ncbi:peptidoglycan-binding domain-containing protein [Clostridium psychrophilum]|uniref:peptidoglycan-binding domain-containing protein n=1 Tax=Clostridium psychrophilum TaxID=132926 RepID=UPI001C0CFCD1|nr:peptidoglycan-binding domain-containing protein [Clostridium psychrophilum]MBU3182559.1 peptidoglycan-binding protein [Clostridium psychrophilum]
MARSTVSIGSTGEDVKYLQQSLTKLSYSVGPTDGIFGSKTETSVRLFQKDKGLVIDGIVGYSTWTAIDNALKLLFTIDNYFSYKENTKYVYEGKWSEYASYSVVVDYLTADHVQLRAFDGGVDLVKVIENKDGKLTLLLSRESDYRENLITMPSNNPEILLKEPLIKGTTWTITGNKKRYISNVEVDITTPLSKYKALEVTTENKSDKTLDYYVANIGLVKFHQH